jgi:hypothetical protein
MVSEKKITKTSATVIKVDPEVLKKLKAKRDLLI